MSTQTEFIKKLQREAQTQSRLHRTRFFPPQLDPLTSLIGRYTWQFLLITSGLTSAAIEIWKRLAL